MGLVFLLMVLSTITWVGWRVVAWMKDVHRLPLSRLVVTGERHYTTNDNIRQSILALGSPGTFITQDINIIQQQIERLPWIKEVNVRKQWPDELKIHLVEYVPAARWNDLYMLDSRGTIFIVPEGNVNNQAMPMLYGPEGSEEDVLAGYRTLNEVLSVTKFHLRSVSMSARRSWQLTLHDDIRLELGRNDRVRRLQRFIAIYPILLQKIQRENKRIIYIDLRYDSGFSVGWAEDFIKSGGNQQQDQVQAKQQCLKQRTEN